MINEAAIAGAELTRTVCEHPDHCITCGDIALPGRVVQLDATAMLALIQIADGTIEVDISLIDAVAPGNTLLVHGGVALERLDEAHHDSG